MHSALETLQDGFFIMDSRWRLTYWNAAAERLLGLPRDSVLGRIVCDVLPSLADSTTAEAARQVRDEGGIREVIETHPADEEDRFFFVRLASTSTGDLTVHFRDATEEVKLAERYASLLESIRNGFISVDPAWTIVYINRVAASLLRLPRRRVVGTDLWSLLPDPPVEVEENLRATMNDGRSRHMRRVRAGPPELGDRVFDLWIVPVPGGGVSALFEDVSEQLRREKDLARYAAGAQEANRAKDRFFAAVSHELRTPLNAMVGYLHLLSTDAYGAMPEGATHAAERASVCAEHLGRLVDDVLMLTTTEPKKLPLAPVPLDLREWLPESVAALRQQAEEKGLSFSVDVPENVLPVVTDPRRLRQLLAVLLTNAVKFTDGGGIRLGVHFPVPDAGARRTGRRAARPPVPHFDITVADSGPGIAAADRERIFSPFEQLGDPARSASMERGAGLGLALARQLATRLSGELWAEEAPGGGALFRLRLPVNCREQGGGRITDNR